MEKDGVVTRNFLVLVLELVPVENIGPPPSVLRGYVWCFSVSSGTFPEYYLKLTTTASFQAPSVSPFCATAP